MPHTATPALEARMALMNLRLALQKLQALRDELQETRADPDRLGRVQLALIRISGAIQETERI